VERRVDDLVAGDRAGGVGLHDVADLPPPSLHQRDAERVRSERRQRAAQRARGQLVELLGHERGRALDLDPSQVGAREDIAALDVRARDLREAVDPGREVRSHVARQAGRARDGPDQTELLRVVARERAGLFEASHHRGRRPEQVDGVGGVAQRAGDAVAHPYGARLVDVEADAAGPDESPAEAAPADRGREIQPVAPQPPAVRRRRQESDVSRQCAEVTGVIRQPFELERDAADDLGARRRRRPGESFECLRVGERVPDARVAGQRLRVVEAPAGISVHQRTLDAAVLVAERDLEVEHLLAVTLEAEVAGLDHSGVYRSDRHFVYLVALDAVVVHLSDRRAVLAREAHRLRPRVPDGLETERLGELALEQVELRALGSQRAERTVRDRADRHAQHAGRVPRQNRHDLRSAGRPEAAEQRADALPARHRLEHVFRERVEAVERDLRERSPHGVAQEQPIARAAHRGAPSRKRAAVRSADSTGGGTQSPSSNTSASSATIGTIWPMRSRTRLRSGAASP
jgi:hypothetical protein